MTALSGRDAELRQLSELLTSGRRLVTLTGPVGVGKSALARAAVADAEESGAFERSCSVELSHGKTVEALLDGVAGTLDSESRAEPAALEQALAGAGVVLLVLDGADALLPALRELVPHWLEAAPELTLLVTSRQAIGVDAEHVVELGPLALPSTEPSGPAAELFLHHARRARPGYEPAREEVPVLIELLRELDGLPLAIELSAARLAVMGPAALLHRLRQSRTVSDKLERALEGAWQGLDAGQQATLSCLAVFCGGFGVEAAEAVVLGVPSVLDTVTALRARSLVSTQQSGQGELRLSLLNCVRDFACRRADPGALAAARARHAAYFAELATRSQSLESERENLEAVLESVLDAGPMTARRAEPALRVLCALHPPGAEPPPARYLALIDPVLERTRDSGADPKLLARALVVSARARRESGDPARALRDLTSAERVARALGAADVEGAALTGLAEILLDQHELDAARDHATRGLEAARRAGDRSAEAWALVTLGAVEAHALDPRAEPLFERAAALFRARGDADGLRRAELGRADVLLDAGEHARAAEHAMSSGAGELVLARARHDAGAGDPGYAEQRGSLALGLGALWAAEQGRLGEAHAALSAALDGPGLDARTRRFFEAVSLWLDSRVLSATPAPSAEHDPVIAALATAARGDVASARVALAHLGPRSWWARAAARLLVPVTAPAWPVDALVVALEGSWFRAPRGEPVSLARRRPLAKLLARLAEEREARPGAPLSWSELLAAAWPGERVLPEAGAHRVRVAVSTLRKLGLAEVLETRGSGYVLDERCTLVRAPS